jgi:hypothetical protein
MKKRRRLTPTGAIGVLRRRVGSARDGEVQGAGSSCGRSGRRVKTRGGRGDAHRRRGASNGRQWRGGGFLQEAARACGTRRKGAGARVNAKGATQGLWVGFYRVRRGRGGDGRVAMAINGH